MTWRNAQKKIILSKYEFDSGMKRVSRLCAKKNYHIGETRMAINKDDACGVNSFGIRIVILNILHPVGKKKSVLVFRKIMERKINVS
jgi:hypothetical protein